ncbi:pentatricopeptide repeat-containing protein At2g39230, mitochondrial-like [Salvia splendens]|uniref:pentatricopeptide repeat-containing protein At2g39230, mitochondrial-like n=1 Tax=Salvia splendens TaxID=180675 RepID=UPI001C278E9F|nr:pentatricopeptide repeat-containing protein At2g39230, mitochondrial-like [Salvia splendens]
MVLASFSKDADQVGVFYVKHANDLGVLFSKDAIKIGVFKFKSSGLYTRFSPQRALDYANWAGKQRGFQAGDSFFVLLHILVRFPNYHNAARSLINNYVCHDSSPSCVVAVDCLIDCAERYGFWLKPRLFDYFLNGYVRAQRYKDAEDCFYALISRRILPCHIILNNFLKCLIRANMIDNARCLFKDVVLKGISYDCDTVYMMMCASLRDGRVEEAEKYFLEAKNSGIKI